MTYKITAERDNETMRSSRISALIAIAKARIWASEGWEVVITDDQGRDYAPSQFEELAPAKPRVVSEATP
ncbi:hypothetical protein HNR60_000919 [Rhodopseudomonas rhenobacensis]|uniref:Uncharacterized protein n=1 Tax=Rhodopseudomonas rhenobacensis TaxID=87461 RepID=A0A7W7Z1F1_9BRAD|nr:hypothetical protein [Rhodopseudomonas rhenobacensis]MBB5046177.1 hypothetical protein [Rhodopseudomonas rhenobacensis]